MRIHCYELFEMVLEEANRQVLPEMVLVQERVIALKKCCDLVDQLIQENDEISLECSIDESTYKSVIAVEFPVVIVDNKPETVFQKLISRAVSVLITNENNDQIKIKFVFPALWDSARNGADL